MSGRGVFLVPPAFGSDRLALAMHSDSPIDMSRELAYVHVHGTYAFFNAWVYVIDRHVITLCNPTAAAVDGCERLHTRETFREPCEAQLN